MKSLIQQLCQVYGPSGNEARVRQILVEAVGEWVDEYRVDALGNLITVRRPDSGAGKRVMLAAHMDEIGVIVTHIDEKGFLRFAPVGSVLPLTLIGARVVFANGVVGTFGVEKELLPSSKPELDQVFLDVGALSREEAPVSVGDVAAFSHQFSDLGQRLIAHNFDDRLGCAILVQVLKELQSTPNEVYVVFTAQEEVGVRGAVTSAFGIEPEVGVAVDVTVAGDTPEAPPVPMALGKGPAIKVKDRRMLAHLGVKQSLVRAAQQNDIPYQMEIMEYGTTDAAAMQTSREGVPAGAVSIPTRYVHTPSQMVDLSDVQNAVKLLVAWLTAPIDLDATA